MKILYTLYTRIPVRKKLGVFEIKKTSYTVNEIDPTTYMSKTISAKIYMCPRNVDTIYIKIRIWVEKL